MKVSEESRRHSTAFPPPPQSVEDRGQPPPPAHLPALQLLSWVRSGQRQRPSPAPGPVRARHGPRCPSGQGATGAREPAGDKAHTAPSGAHLVWGRGIGREMQRKGSKVSLCFWQRGHVREDLRGQRRRTPVKTPAATWQAARGGAGGLVPVLGLEQLLNESAADRKGRSLGHQVGLRRGLNKRRHDFTDCRCPSPTGGAPQSRTCPGLPTQAARQVQMFQ